MEADIRIEDRPDAVEEQFARNVSRCPIELTRRRKRRSMGFQPRLCGEVQR